MSARDLVIDLDDGMPVATVSKEPKPRAGVTRYAAPAHIAITSVPTSVVISYARIHCLGCGGEHRDHRGIFLELKLSNKVRVLERKTLREIAVFAELPRKIDVAPDEAIPICCDCFMIERAFRDAVAVAQVQGELFGEPGKPSQIDSIAERLKEIHSATDTVLEGMDAEGRLMQ